MDVVLKAKVTIYLNLKKKLLHTTNSEGKATLDSDYAELRTIQLEKFVDLHRDTFLCCVNNSVSMKIAGIDFHYVHLDHFDFDSNSIIVTTTQDFYREADEECYYEATMLNYKDELLSKGWELVKDETKEGTESTP